MKLFFTSKGPSLSDYLLEREKQLQAALNELNSALAEAGCDIRVALEDGKAMDNVALILAFILRRIK